MDWVKEVRDSRMGLKPLTYGSYLLRKTKIKKLNFYFKLE